MYTYGTKNRLNIQYKFLFAIKYIIFILLITKTVTVFKGNQITFFTETKEPKIRHLLLAIINYIQSYLTSWTFYEQRVPANISSLLVLFLVPTGWTY